jgi:hypothetical protein
MNSCFCKKSTPYLTTELLQYRLNKRPWLVAGGQASRYWGLLTTYQINTLEIKKRRTINLSCTMRSRSSTTWNTRKKLELLQLQHCSSFLCLVFLPFEFQQNFLFLQLTRNQTAVLVEGDKSFAWLISTVLLLFSDHPYSMQPTTLLHNLKIK